MEKESKEVNKERLKEVIRKFVKDSSGALAYLPDARKALGTSNKRSKKPGKSMGLQNPNYPENPALRKIGGTLDG